MNTKSTFRAALTIVLLFSIRSDASAQTTLTNIHMDPRGAYARLCSDDVAFPPSIIDLSALSISPGDLLRLTSFGDFKFGVGDSGESARDMLGVFSSSSVLGPSTEQFRVVGAIDAGADTISTAACADIDIPEDFYIPTNGVVIRVPNYALYLFVQAADNRLGDNSDPDGDFVLRINRECDPCATISVSQVRVCWSTESNILYRVDYKSTLTSNTWTPLVTDVVGNGATNCVFDAVTEEKRFYQVVRQP